MEFRVTKSVVNSALSMLCYASQRSVSTLLLKWPDNDVHESENTCASQSQQISTTVKASEGGPPLPPSRDIAQRAQDDENGGKISPANDTSSLQLQVRVPLRGN